jgi:hypothetical protein
MSSLAHAKLKAPACTTRRVRLWSRGICKSILRTLQSPYQCPQALPTWWMVSLVLPRSLPQLFTAVLRDAGAASNQVHNNLSPSAPQSIFHMIPSFHVLLRFSITYPSCKHRVVTALTRQCRVTFTWSFTTCNFAIRNLPLPRRRCLTRLAYMSCVCALRRVPSRGFSSHSGHLKIVPSSSNQQQPSTATLHDTRPRRVTSLT